MLICIEGNVVIGAVCYVDCLCVKVASTCHAPFSLTLSQARWTPSDQDLLDKFSGRTILSLVCILFGLCYNRLACLSDAQFYFTLLQVHVGY